MKSMDTENRGETDHFMLEEEGVTDNEEDEAEAEKGEEDNVKDKTDNNTKKLSGVDVEEEQKYDEEDISRTEPEQEQYDNYESVDMAISSDDEQQTDVSETKVAKKVPIASKSDRFPEWGDGPSCDVDTDNEAVQPGSMSWLEDLWKKKKAEEARAALKNTDTSVSEEMHQMDAGEEMLSNDELRSIVGDGSHVSDGEEFKEDDFKVQIKKQYPKDAAHPEASEKKQESTSVRKSIKGAETNSDSSDKAKGGFTGPSVATLKKLTCIPCAYFGPSFDKESFKCCVRIYRGNLSDLCHPEIWGALNQCDTLCYSKLKGSEETLELFTTCEQLSNVLAIVLFMPWTLNHVTMEVDYTHEEDKAMTGTPDSTVEGTPGWRFNVTFSVRNVYALTTLKEEKRAADSEVSMTSSLFIKNLPDIMPRQLLAALFPKGIVAGLTDIVPATSCSAIVQMSSDQVVYDHLISFYNFSVNGRKLELSGINISHEEVMKGLNWKALLRKRKEEIQERQNAMQSKDQTDPTVSSAVIGRKQPSSNNVQPVLWNPVVPTHSNAVPVWMVPGVFSQPPPPLPTVTTPSVSQTYREWDARRKVPSRLDVLKGELQKQTEKKTLRESRVEREKTQGLEMPQNMNRFQDTELARLGEIERWKQAVEEMERKKEAERLEEIELEKELEELERLRELERLQEIQEMERKKEEERQREIARQRETQERERKKQLGMQKEMERQREAQEKLRERQRQMELQEMERLKEIHRQREIQEMKRRREMERQQELNRVREAERLRKIEQQREMERNQEIERQKEELARLLMQMKNQQEQQAQREMPRQQQMSSQERGRHHRDQRQDRGRHHRDQRQERERHHRDQKEDQRQDRGRHHRDLEGDQWQDRENYRDLKGDQWQDRERHHRDLEGEQRQDRERHHRDLEGDQWQERERHHRDQTGDQRQERGRHHSDHKGERRKQVSEHEAASDLDWIAELERDFKQRQSEIPRSGRQVSSRKQDEEGMPGTSRSGTSRPGTSRDREGFSAHDLEYMAGRSAGKEHGRFSGQQLAQASTHQQDVLPRKRRFKEWGSEEVHQQPRKREYSDPARDSLPDMSDEMREQLEMEVARQALELQRKMALLNQLQQQK